MPPSRTPGQGSAGAQLQIIPSEAPLPPCIPRRSRGSLSGTLTCNYGAQQDSQPQDASLVGNTIPRLPPARVSYNPWLQEPGGWAGGEGEALSKPEPLSAGARTHVGCVPRAVEGGSRIRGRGLRGTGPRPVAAAEPGARIPPLPVQSHLRLPAFNTQHKGIRRWNEWI